MSLAGFFIIGFLIISHIPQDDGSSLSNIVSQKDPRFSCLGRRDGLYMRSPCNDRYFKCKYEVLGELTCDDMEYVFDEKAGKCIPAEKSDACYIIPKVPSFNCSEKTNGDYSVNRCSRLFFSCVYNLAVPIFCPPTKVFRSDMGSCYFERFTAACGYVVSEQHRISRINQTIIASSRKHIRYTFSCLNKARTLFPDPRKDCSSIYFGCAGSMTGIQFACSGTTYFDKRIRRCRLLARIPSCVKATPRPPSNSICPEVYAPPGIFPNPDESCSRTFIACRMDGVATKKTCPKDTYFDKSRVQCLFFQDVPECSGVVITTTGPPDIDSGTGVQAVAPIDLTDEFDCRKQPNGNFAAPGLKCVSYFYQCAHGTTFRLNCTRSLYYDRVTDRCDYAKNVPGCKRYQPKPEIVQICKDKIPGFYPNPASCSSYIACIDKSDGVLIECGGKFVFDPKNGHCTQEESVLPPCGFKIEEPLTFTCPSQNGNFQGSSCLDYISCKNGVPEKRNCSDGKAFDWISSKECKVMAKVLGCSPLPDQSLTEICLEARFNVLSHPSGNSNRGLICMYGKAFSFNCFDPQRPTFRANERACIEAK